MYVELDDSTKGQVAKLRKEFQETINDAEKRYESVLRQKDDNIRQALNEIDLLRSAVT
jgi:hypothetical protein